MRALRRLSVLDRLEQASKPRPPAVVATPLGTGKGFVAHGEDAAAARPGYESVEWQGTAEPENAVNGDTWLKTGASPQLYVRVAGEWKAVA